MKQEFWTSLLEYNQTNVPRDLDPHSAYIPSVAAIKAPPVIPIYQTGGCVLPLSHHVPLTRPYRRSSSSTSITSIFNYYFSRLEEMVAFHRMILFLAPIYAVLSVGATPVILNSDSQVRLQPDASPCCVPLTVPTHSARLCRLLR